MPRFSLGRGGGGGTGGGGGGAKPEIIHDPSVVDPIPILFDTPGIKQAIATASSGVTALQMLTAGIFTVDSISTPQIDFSGIPSGIGGLNPAIALITAAMATDPAFDDYAVSIGFINPNFHFTVTRTGADVGVLSGDVVTAMGLNAVTETSFSPKSPSITIPPPATGYWSELQFFSIFTISRDFHCTCNANLISDGTDTHSWLNATSNNGAWFQHQESNESSGLYTLSKATYYSFVYADFAYNLATGEITWDNPRPVVPQTDEVYKMNSLLAIGWRS